LDVLSVGIASLYAFVQAGWTGPELGFEPIDLLPAHVRTKAKDLDKKALDNLSVGGEELYHLSPQILFLHFAKILLVDHLEELKKDALVGKSAPWWALRTLFLQQRTLEGPTGLLQEQMVALLDELETVLNKEKEVLTRFWIEKGLVLHCYTEDTKAYEAFQKAQSTSGFRFKVTGALGKRTKFQQYDTSQLVVVAESSREMASSRPSAYKSEAGSGPKNLEHNDDTVLEKIQFSELSEEDRARLGELELDPSKAIEDLHPIDHALLLAFCLNIKNTNPAHGLTVEQMFPFVTRVLETPNNWTVYTMALLLRSRLEADKSRTVERGALQLQALVDQTRIHDESSTTRERMHHFFSVLLPSKWELEKELAEQYMALGVVRSAMDIFERLELWEDVIACHQFLDQADKAKALCYTLLEKTPNNPKLLCILGDLDQDPEKYKEAWEASGQRFARAQRSLGAYYFKRDQFQEAMTAYQLALKINPLFENSWYVLGCIGMQVEDFDVAIEAFTRVVSIDQSNGEAWNNIAAVHMRRKNNLDAQHALRQALKEKRESWKIWSNYMYCSMDVGDFTEAIRAMGMLVELRWKAKKEENTEEIVDIVILDRIVQGLTRDLKDLYSRSVTFQEQKIEELLLGITNRITTDPRIWRICVKFYFWKKDFVECLECQLKAYRSVIHNPKIETEQAEFEKAVEAAIEMVDWYRNLGPMTYKDEQGQEHAVAKDWAYRSKQMIKSLMARTRDSWEHLPAFEKLQDTMEELKSE
ncbi:TPR-like protein, partial [Linnemannia elongata AG-77]